MQAQSSSKLFVLPFEKFHKSFLFPSVACSSYLVTLFSFQGAFPASFETRSKHSISLNACIQSRTISLGPVPDGTRGVPRTSVLAKPKPCRRGNSFAPRNLNHLGSPANCKFAGAHPHRRVSGPLQELKGFLTEPAWRQRRVSMPAPRDGFFARSRKKPARRRESAECPCDRSVPAA